MTDDRLERGQGPSLASFVANVWAPRAKRRLAIKTWERDAFVYRKHIRPALGRRLIAEIDVEDLVDWQDRLEGGEAWRYVGPTSALASQSPEL